MKKSFFSAALAMLVGTMLTGHAFAQSVPQASTYFGENSGRISVQAATYGSVNGNGGSMSHAETQADAHSNGFVSQNAAGVAMGGEVGGSVKAVAYNTVIGSGVGSASAGGWSDASFNANAATVNPTGFVQGAVGVDGGMGNAVRNGVDAHVIASTAQDGFAQGTFAGTAALVGTVGQVAIPGGGAVTGAVVGLQTSDGTASAGAVTFTDGAPAGQSAAVRFANTGVEVNVTGNFDDPAK